MRLGRSFLGKSKDPGEEAFYLTQLCVNSWFANSLGRLVVFPHDFASIAVHKLIQSASRQNWKNSSESLAFFLPMVSLGFVTNAQRITLGSQQAQGVFMGGGPFVLEDSSDIVERALRALSYLDDGLNGDLEEAQFCFLNSSNNKHSLWKLAMLPSSGDTSQKVMETLRAAFLSNRSQGQWYIPRPELKPLVLRALKSEGLINCAGSVGYSGQDLLQAMKVYGRRHGLPAMRTFNCSVRWIQN